MLLDKKGKMLCYDIVEKFGFSKYAMLKTLDATEDSSSNNKYYYRLYWAATLYVVIEGIYHDSVKKNPRLSDYDDFKDEINNLRDLVEVPFSKSTNNFHKVTVLKRFRNYLFHPQYRYRSDARRHALEIRFPYDELKEITELIDKEIIEKIKQGDYYPYSSGVDDLTIEWLKESGLDFYKNE
jgi:hypothetical protein